MYVFYKHKEQYNSIEVDNESTIKNLKALIFEIKLQCNFSEILVSLNGIPYNDNDEIVPETNKLNRLLIVDNRRKPIFIFVILLLINSSI